jgi:hypothetical protein
VRTRRYPPLFSEIVPRRNVPIDNDRYIDPRHPCPRARPRPILRSFNQPALDGITVDVVDHFMDAARIDLEAQVG